MTRRIFFMVCFGLSIVFSNGSTFNAKFDENGQVSNAARAREDTDHPFHFTPTGYSGYSTREIKPETALCPTKLPIVCYKTKNMLCVEDDKNVFYGLNNENNTQTVTFSKIGGESTLFQEDDQFTCRHAHKTTDLTIEEFEIIFTSLSMLTQKRLKNGIKLKNITEDYQAVCKVSNSDHSTLFAYHEGHGDDDYMKFMIKIKNKRFHINGKEYSLSCYPRTDQHTAKQVFEAFEKDYREEKQKKVNYAKLGTDEKWYEDYRYQLGLTLLFCIIVVTLSLCCCSTNNGDPDNEDPNNHYPSSSDLVLEILDTVSSLSTVSSTTDSIPPSIHTTTDSTNEENTQSNSVEQTLASEFKTRSVELTKVIRSQSKSIEKKENTQSQKESVDLKKNIQPQSNSVELKEDTQSQTKSFVLEDAQSQSDAIEKENTQSDTDSLFN